MSEEIFKYVPGYEQFYIVSSFGRVFSLNYRNTGRIHELAQSSLCDKRRSSGSMYRRAKMWHIEPNTPTAIHRLVAKAFIPNPNGFTYVNHIDGNKSNNHSDNLEWVNNSMNQIHAFEHGLHVYRQGDAHPMALLTNDQAREIKDRLKTPYRGQGVDLAREYNVSVHVISSIKVGKNWKEVA